jgi:hypothetical protein
VKGNGNSFSSSGSSISYIACYDFKNVNGGYMKLMFLVHILTLVGVCYLIYIDKKK